MIRVVSDEELYEDTYVFIKWSEIAYVEINRELSLRSRPPLPLAKWKSAVSYYLLEVTNFIPLLDEIYAGLLRFIAFKTGIGNQEISDIMLNAGARIKRSDAELTEPVITRTPDDRVEITIGVIKMTLPKSRYLLLNSEANHVTPHLKSLILRYSMLDIGTGYFWSVEPKLYRQLEAESILPVLECFASPFNYTASNYCSMFADDRNMPNPEGVQCKGSFFDFIETLTANRVPARLLFNPPYTGRMLTKSISLLLEYLNLVPQAEVLALLPNWQDFQAIRDFINHDGSVTLVLEESKYKIYDFTSGNSFSPHKTSLILVANFAHSRELSQNVINFSQKLMA